MAAETLGFNAWSHDLSGRDRDFKLFKIPTGIVTNCGIVPRTNRTVSVELSTGETFRWPARITSGTEIYFPAAYWESLRASDFFRCEIED